MSLDVLEASMSRAFAAVDHTSRSKAPSPVSMFAADSSFGGDRAYGGDHHAEQLGHFRGRFYAAVRVIVARTAMQPVHIAKHRRRAPRSGRHESAISVPPWMGDASMWDVLKIHPFLSVWNRPNSFMTSYNVVEMFVASAYVTGRAFLVFVKGHDRPLDMFAIPSTWMTPLHTKGRPYSEWIIRPPGSLDDGIKVSGSQVVHFFFADPSNPMAAISPMMMIARDILVDEAISSAQHSSFKHPMPRFALIAGQEMSEQSFTDDPNRTSSARPATLAPMQRRQIITWMRQQGVNFKNGDPLILDSLIRDIKEIGRKNIEMGYLESSNMTREHIFEAVSVSKVLTGQLDGTNRAGAGIAEQFLVDNTLNTLITGMSQALNMTAGPLFSTDNDELGIWIEEASPRDNEINLEWARLLNRGYAIERNELRRISPFKLPAIEGMDDVVIPQTMEEREGSEDRVGVGRQTVGAAESATN